MSYDIYFVNKSKITLEEIELIIENEAEDGDPLYISKTLMNDIITLFKSNDLNFSVFSDETGKNLELTFQNFQIQIFTNQICLSIQYSVSDNNIYSEIKKITDLFIHLGFTGFDPQINKILDEDFSFSESYCSVQSKILTKVSIDNNEFSFWDK